MTPMADFLKTMATKMIANPSMTKVQATDELQLATNGVKNVDGNAWFDEIAIFYESLGTINNPTFGAWRASIVTDGEAKSWALIDATAQALNAILPLAEIGLALRVKNIQDRLQATKDDIIVVRAFRDAQTDPAVVKALNIGIQELIAKRNGLEQRVSANQ